MALSILVALTPLVFAVRLFEPYISAKEIEPFYRLMQIAKQAPFIARKSVAESETTDRSIVKLLDALTLKNKKRKPVMERVSMNMRIVRVSIVRVEDPAQAALLGGDRYYQLDGMADIGNRAYEDLGDKNSTGNKVPILHHKEYPVTCVCLELPSWLMSGDQNPNGDSRSDSEAVWYGAKSQKYGILTIGLPGKRSR